jgi:hypothetical protein
VQCATSKCAGILEVEPTTAVWQAEVTAAKRMITGTAERLGIYPARATGIGRTQRTKGMTGFGNGSYHPD